MTDTEVTALVLEVEDSIACYDEMLTQQQKAPKQPTPDALNITGKSLPKVADPLGTVHLLGS